MAAADPPAGSNRLIDSNDPYLLLHAHNPVDWYPWGAQALEKARREQKPIFLSVGYSTCYWCHVAEETIFSKQEFADQMNAWFVNIKVDSEQRPDIDRLYMAATVAMTGHGGWPNNVFLTPELKPFFAGSYFPPHDDGSGRPGFDRIIRAIHASWTQDPAKVRDRAEKLMAALRELHPAPGEPGGHIDAGVLAGRAVAAWSQRADQQHGGFGAPNGARFPLQPVLFLLMAEPKADRLALLVRTLDAMAAGGIYDHLAGGFHRYAVEPTWSIPHFEKMLADNAQLLAIYAQAFTLTQDARYRAVAVEVADYLTQRMMAPDGGFYTAEDATVDGREGSSYLWTRPEIITVLGARAATQFFDRYELTPLPDTDPGHDEGAGVLRRRLSGDAAAPDDAAWRAQLLAARDRRRQPARDEKIVVALNGLAIQAFAQAGQRLGAPQYVEVARRAADALWRNAYDPVSGLRHELFRGRAQTDAFLDDYALLGRGLLALHEAEADAVWLQRAGALADAMLARFQRPDGGFSTTIAEKDLPMAPPEDGDNVLPSASSAAVDFLLRLQRATGTTRYLDAARGIVGHFGPRLEDAPEAWPAMLLALADNAFAPAAHAAAGALTTESVVRASATLNSTAEQDEVVFTLQIDAGYHVNANPASYPYLIATSVSFAGLTPTQVRYPDATLFKPAFLPAGLKVYEGTVRLQAAFPKGALGAQPHIDAIVATQACNSEICLPPAKLMLTLTRGGQP